MTSPVDSIGYSPGVGGGSAGGLEWVGGGEGGGGLTGGETVPGELGAGAAGVGVGEAAGVGAADGVCCGTRAGLRRGRTTLMGGSGGTRSRTGIEVDTFAGVTAAAAGVALGSSPST